MAEPQAGQGFGDRRFMLSGIQQALDKILAFLKTFGESHPTNCLLVLCAWMYMYVCRGETDKGRLKCMRP